ncbi:MAG TPA: BTAD domain-containing putative transcriptional regulator [Gemmatimonadaceae bacterium]|nr:BTAD domain-containing putative transcriptional regulator [Gemmatimonadaceae bacterium]
MTTATGSSRLHLRTLGTLRLAGTDDDTVLGEHGHHRRRLALLAAIATAGERGRSRDQLLGLLWPDAPQDRGRHSLDQLLYAIRTSLNGPVFAGANPIRLNEEFISSDIAAFQSALERGDLESAVQEYAGPFLEGFYLSDSPDFEQWMDAERARIERSYTDALEQLAKRAEDAKHYAVAARWRQKLTDADPVSSKNAIGLIRALTLAGDHAAALKYAERYEALVAQELGTSVGPSVASLVAEVRERAKTESVVVRGKASAKRPRTDHSLIAEASRHEEPPRDVVPREEIAEVSPPEPPARRNRAIVPAIAAAAALVLIAGAMWLRPRADTPIVANDASIAVLPLANLSGDRQDAPIVDGLSEAMIGVLAKIPRLRVMARTSALRFRNSNLDPRTIGDSLNVANLLEGSAQRIGDRIRVQIRLVDTRDGSTRWAETYDRETRDIFLVQSEIAEAVASQLNLRLGAPAIAAVRRGPTSNIAAYELYLRAADPANLRSDSSVQFAAEEFKHAIALDPKFAAAYAGLARMYQRMRETSAPPMPPRRLHELAVQMAHKAVELDDSLAEAHATVGVVELAGYNFPEADRELSRAVQIDPFYSRAREWLSFAYTWNQQHNDAFAEATRSVENDPLSPSAHAEVGRTLCMIGKYPQGLDRLKRLSSVTPPLLRVPVYTGICYGMMRNWSEASAAFRRSRGPVASGLLGFSLAREGKTAEADSVLTGLIKRWETRHSGAFHVATVYAGMGNLDQAFTWLDRSVDDYSLSFEIMAPLFSELHADPRFEKFRQRIGLQKR